MTRTQGCSVKREFRAQGCTLYCVRGSHKTGEHMNNGWDAGDAEWLQKSGRIVGDKYYWRTQVTHLPQEKRTT